MAASFQDGGYYVTQNKCFRKLSDHRYCNKLKGSIHDRNVVVKLYWFVFFYESDVKAQPGHTGDITAVRPSMGFSVCF